MSSSILRLLLGSLVAFLVASAALPAAAQYGGTPTITADPSAAPGATVQVTVTGCSPPGARVDILFDGDVVGTATIGADGSFSTQIVIPGDAVGEGTISVMCDGTLLSTVITIIGPGGSDGDGSDDGSADDGGDDGAAPGPDDRLPSTGSDTRPLLQVGLGLVGVGALLVFFVRRRLAEREPAA